MAWPTPWNVRHPNPAEHQAWRNCLQLHDLTLAWLTDLGLDPREFHKALEKGMSPILAPVFRALELRDFESVLISDQPLEALDRVHHVAWSLHAWSLKRILTKSETPKFESERAILLNQLEQTSWKAGRAAFAERWSGLHSPRLETGPARPVETALLALIDTFLTGISVAQDLRPDPFLIRRSLPDTVELELLRCPHTLPALEAESVKDELCRLHSEWMRGFIYAANPKVVMETARKLPESGRCRQVWTLHSVGISRSSHL